MNKNHDKLGRFAHAPGGGKTALVEKLSFDQPTSTTTRALLDGKHIATLGWWNPMMAEAMDVAPYSVQKIHVHPDYRRKGVATALFNWTKNNAEPQLSHSLQMTDMGAGWAASMGHRPKKYEHLTPMSDKEWNAKAEAADALKKYAKQRQPAARNQTHRIPIESASKFYSVDVRNEVAHLVPDIKKNGIKKPIEIATDGETAYITDGNHRVAAAHQAGLMHVPVKVKWVNNAGANATPVDKHILGVLRAQDAEEKAAAARKFG